MGTIEGIASFGIFMSFAVGTTGFVGFLVAAARRAPLRNWAIAWSVGSMLLVASGGVGAWAAEPRLQREREMSYAAASALLAQGNKREAIPLLGRAQATQDAPEKLADARSRLSAELFSEMDKVESQIEHAPDAARANVSGLLKGVNEALVGGDYPKLRLRADSLLEKLDTRAIEPTRTQAPPLKDNPPNPPVESQLGRVQPAAEACADLGFRFGQCAGLGLTGKTCDPKDNFGKPAACNGSQDWDRALARGVQSVVAPEPRRRADTPGAPVEPAPVKDDFDMGILARAECKAAIEQQAKDPDSVQWPSVRDEVAESKLRPFQAKDGTWRWNSWFSATNSFGGRIRTPFRCTFDPAKGIVRLKVTDR
jgi:hypothetical protein